MTDLAKIRRSHIVLMERTCATLGHVLARVDQATATTLRDRNDGPKGWTVLEVVCHLRDFDGIFRRRAQMMLAETHPALPAYDHEQMAIDQAYNRQDLRQVYADFARSREETIAFFRGLDADQWERTGEHPERGFFTMTDAVIQVGTHDITHLEQITRILFT